MGRRLLLIYVAGLTGFVVYAAFGLRPGPSAADFRKLDEDIAAFMAQRWEREPELGGGVEGTAFDHYVDSLRWADDFQDSEEWDERYEEFETAIEDLRSALPGEEKDLPRELFERLGADSSGFDGLLAGARTSVVTPPPGFFTPWEGGVRNVNGATIRLAELVAASVPVLVRERRPNLAVDRLVALHQLGRDVAVGSGLLGQMVGLTIGELSLKRLGDVVATGSLSPAGVARVRGWTAERPGWDLPGRRLFEAETVGVRQMLYREVWQEAETVPSVRVLLAALGLEPPLPLLTRGRQDYHRYRPLLDEMIRRFGHEPDPFLATCRAAKSLPKSDPLLDLIGIWPKLQREVAEYRTAREGLRHGIDLWSQREETGALPTGLPAGWTLKPIPGKAEIGLYPKGAGPDGWVFRMPAGR